MPGLKMEVYDSKDELTSVITWANEDEYRQAEEFLAKLGVGRVPPADAVDKTADFYLTTQEQHDRFYSYENKVRANRPRVGPPSLDMEFYWETAGVYWRTAWADEDEYQKARQFLLHIGALDFPAPTARYERPEFFMLRTAEQDEAFREFSKAMQKKRTKPLSLHMALYVDSVDSGTVTWANEDEYRQAKQFLLSNGIEPDFWPSARAGDPEYFSLDKEQYRAFLEFKKSIEEKRGA